MSLFRNDTDLGLLVLRIGTSALMLLHGVAKLANGAAGIKPMLAQQGLPEFFAYGALVGEVVAPILILFGFRTRLAAAVLAFNCAVALWLGHGNHLCALSATGGWMAELPALYLIPALALIFTGGGRFALSSRSRWD